MTMDKSEKHEPQTTFQTPDSAVETPPITRTRHELLEDAGNCRHSVNQELSLHLLSEQRKLRHVLDWADSFLCTGSEVCQEFCRADSLILADVKQRGTEERSSADNHSSPTKYQRPVSCAVGSDGILGGGGGGGGGSFDRVWQHGSSNYKSNYLFRDTPPFPSDLHFPFSFSTGKDEETWPGNRETENMKTMEVQRTTNEQTSSQDCRTSRPHMCNQRHHTDISDSSSNQAFTSDAAAHLIKESTSSWSNASRKKRTAFGAVSTLKSSLKSSHFTNMIYKPAGAQLRGEMSENQKEPKKEVGEVEEDETEKREDDRMEENYEKMHKEQESSSEFVAYACNKISHNEPVRTPEQRAKTANTTCHLKRLTVYEQYQLCVDKLHHLRRRQSQHMKSGCFTQSPENERKTYEESVESVEAPVLPASSSELNTSITNRENEKHLNDGGGERVTAAETRSKKQHRSKNNRNGATLTEHREAKSVKETPAAFSTESRRLCQENTPTSTAHFGKDRADFVKKTAEAITSTDEAVNTLKGHLGTKCDDVPPEEESAALTANPGLMHNNIRRHPGRKCQRRAPKKRSEARGPRRLCENPVMSFSGGMLPSSREGAIKRTKKPDDRMKHTAPFRDTHTILQPTETHTLHRDDPEPTSSAEGTRVRVSMNNKYNPAGVPVCGPWLCLPDEVWLSILSLVPHRDLCRVVQVCHRLHTLATDHTLWKNLRIENSAVTDQWLLCVGRRRPHSLRLYSCSDLSVSSGGLEMFFSRCRNSLEELKVTSCTGPGLHGDQMLSLIGQLCNHVTSVDVSWSGATDTGVNALSDCRTRLRLKSVVLNGCHVTDVPLKELVMRHRESLRRLEVFGCQFLTPSCLQTVYEMCPSLQHLNIGQLPKVSVRSLTAMTSQLKCLISLNLTGLQVVNDTTVDTLLQNCVKLQSLTLSSCPGVTDLTLHSVSKYTPCIRALDVSGCKAITDAGVRSLALGCRRLQQLDLSSTCTGNRGVSLLANYCSKHLQAVKLSFCHITLEKILKLCRRCKRLKVLHLYGCALLPTEAEIREVNSSVKVYPLA